MSDSSFWQRAVQAQQPSEPAPMANGDAYRAWQAAKPAGGSGSRIYDLPALPQQRAQARTSIYEPREYSLAQYQKPTTSKWARRSDESGDGYLARTGAILRAIETLPEAEQTLIIETREAILTADPKSVNDAHAELRGIIGQRQAANGVQGQGIRGFNGGFGGEQVVEKLGGTPAPAPLSGARLPSIVEISAKLREQEEQRMAAIPQRTSTDHLRSSGDGIVQVPGAAL